MSHKCKKMLFAIWATMQENAFMSHNARKGNLLIGEQCKKNSFDITSTMQEKAFADWSTVQEQATCLMMNNVRNGHLSHGPQWKKMPFAICSTIQEKAVCRMVQSVSKGRLPYNMTDNARNDRLPFPYDPQCKEICTPIATVQISLHNRVVWQEPSLFVDIFYSI